MPAADALVIGSDPEACEVGRSLLSRGNAVDATMGAVFAAAALHPSVLLGPVQILIGGAGAGLQAFDGRNRQPGLGNPRPRGFLPSEPIAPAARVGVPGLPAALLAAVTTYGKLSVAGVISPALELARAKSELRAVFFERMTQRGPAALAEAVLADELVVSAGRMAGGLLSHQDLDELRPGLTPPNAMAIRGRELFTVPWGASAVRHSEAQGIPASDVRVVTTVDRNGMIAIACYAVPRDGLTLHAFDLIAPFTAAPVLRGQPRVKPGEGRGAAAPIAMASTRGVLDLAVGLGATTDAEAILGAWLQSYEPESELERSTALPAGLAGVQRAGSSWATLSGLTGTAA